MIIDEKMADSIALLARLQLSGEILEEDESKKAKEQLLSEFNKIVTYMDILAEAKTDGVEPMYSPMLEPLGPRLDIPGEEKSKAENILEQAPDRIGRFFSVPRIF
jgi:aspartyl/glutamyl-tRNA(Asn/Gln) amidotransferase C subunit